MSISDYTKGVDKSLLMNDQSQAGDNNQPAHIMSNASLEINDLDDNFWDDDDEMAALVSPKPTKTMGKTVATESAKGNGTTAYVCGTVVAVILLFVSIVANSLTYSFIFMMVMGYESSTVAALDNPNMALVVIWVSGLFWHTLFAWLTVRLMRRVSKGYDKEIRYYLIPFVVILVLAVAIFPMLTGTLKGVSIYAIHAVLLLLFGEIYIRRGNNNTMSTERRSSGHVVNWAVIIPWVLLVVGVCISAAVARNMYSSGYSQGVSDAASAVATELKEAVEDAYNEGYEKGMDDGYEELTDWYGEYAQQQYDAGYSDGYDTGYNLGHTEGYNQGFMAGSW